MEEFSLKKLNNVGFTEQYQVKISNMSAALEKLDVNVDINMSLKNITESIKTSIKES
jgi:hypothetical protein